MVLFLLLFGAFYLPASALPLAGVNWRTLPTLLAALMAGWFLLAVEGRSPGALGFHASGEAPLEGGRGVLVGALVALCTLVGIFALGGIRWVPDEGNLTEYLREGVWTLWFLTLPAAAEEALFRGYLLQGTAEAWGGWPALWFTSVAFGLIHLSNPNTSTLGILNIIVAGLFLGAVYLRTASLWWATGAHLGWNWTLGFLADAPVSGLEIMDTPAYEALSQGPRWISGGTFGPEGSLVATFVLSVAAWLVWKSPAFQPGRVAREVRPLILSAPGIVPGGLEGDGDRE